MTGVVKWSASTSFIVLAALCLPLVANAGGPADTAAWRALPSETLAAPRLELFRTPPLAARPRVWWHWVDGNVTKDGITKDLEWMRRVGVGGFQLFDVGVSVDRYVEHPVNFFSAAWLDAVGHAAAEAKRLGLEMAMNAGAGWSETGAPWVKPEQAMKKYVWSETIVAAGTRGPIRLAPPPSRSGTFQDLGLGQEFHLPPIHGSRPGTAASPGTPPPIPTYYRDQRVFAFPLATAPLATTPRITLNGVPFAGAALADGRYADGLPVPTNGKPVALSFDFGRPTALGSVTIGFAGTFPDGAVEASADGRSWRKLADLPGQSHIWFGGSPVRTFAFPTQTARYFRLRLSPPPPLSWDDRLLDKVYDPDHRATEVRWDGAKVARFEDKAGFGLLYDYQAEATPIDAAAIDPAKVIDLTDRLNGDGTLRWTPPPGRWSVVRLGYSLTGATNHPVTAGAEGLEVDKLNAGHVGKFVDRLLEPIAKQVGGNLPAGGFSDLLLDSWEAGQNNWTVGILDEFAHRRGYAAAPWLPVLAGHVVGNGERSDRFLWDWRLTLAELLADNHNAVIQRAAEQHGIGVYAEAMGTGMGTVGDNMALKALATVPMAEFWYVPTGDPNGQRLYRYETDVREAASVANTYGRPVVAAEAFTTLPEFTPWGQGPKDLKWVADFYATEGVNRFVVASSVHQPLDDMRPGMALYKFGQFLSRQDAWAEQSRGWFEYLARVSYMLQRGRHQADIALFQGEGAPMTVKFWQKFMPAMPVGYDYDYVDHATLIGQLVFRDGRLTLPSGASFAALVLAQDTSKLTLGTIRKLTELVRAGATIVAPPVAGSPSLTDDDQAVRAAAAVLWGSAKPGTPVDRPLGAGRIVWGKPLADVLGQAGTTPDLMLEGAKERDEVKWIHRTGAGIDIYYFANMTDRPLTFDASVAVSARDVTLWDPETGATAPAAYQPQGKRTRLMLTLAARQSTFAVLAGPAIAGGRERTASAERILASLDVNWSLSADGAGPPALKQTTPQSWTELDDAWRGYSGTATYRTTVQIGGTRRGRTILDLGKVEQFAELWVNDQRIGLDWIAPYRFDITAAVRPGPNAIRIAVTNLFANRLIVDAKLPAADAKTATVFRPFADAPDPPAPLVSGLIGPVRLLNIDTSEEKPKGTARN